MCFCCTIVTSGNLYLSGELGRCGRAQRGIVFVGSNVPLIFLTGIHSDGGFIRGRYQALDARIELRIDVRVVMAGFLFLVPASVFLTLSHINGLVLPNDDCNFVICTEHDLLDATFGIRHPFDMQKILSSGCRIPDTTVVTSYSR